MCKKPPKRRKVGDTLEAIALGGAGTVTYQWRANDLPILGATSATFKVNADYVGQVISVIVTDEEGNTAESEDTAPVTNDMSAEITLNDLDGLQTDGTALAGDTLQVSYGADLGTPSVVIWYCNGAVKALASLDGAGITNRDFRSGVAVNRNGVLDAGEWWVTIENTAGITSVSNVITVKDEADAAVSNFMISNDYETANSAGLSFLANDAKPVVTVTLNKDYDGVFYIYPADNTTYNSTVGTGKGNAVAKLDLTKAGRQNTTNESYIVPVTKPSQLTEAKALALGTATRAAGIGTALKYVSDATGETTYMFMPETGANGASAVATITRGTSYVIAFDQDGVDSDDISTTNRDDIEVSDAYEAPYLLAPAEIKVSSYDSDVTNSIELTFVDESGETMEWWTEGAALASTIASGTVYNVASNTKADSDEARSISALAITKGVGTATYVGSGATYAYAKVKTVAGIFAEKAAEYESAVVESAPKAATKVEVAEDSTPENAVIKFTGLHNKADGTVYLIQGESGKGTKDLILAKGTDAAIGSVGVNGGSTSATIENVFKQAQIAGTANNLDKFVAVFVPSDTSTYSKISSDMFTLKSVASGLSFKAADTSMVTYANSADPAAGAAQVVTITTDTSKVDTLNQFGTPMTAGFSTVSDKALTVAADNAGGDTVETVNGGTYSVDANGVVTMNVNLTSTIDQGDGFTIDILGSKIKAVAKFGVNTDNGLSNDNLFKVTLGSNVLQDTAVTAITISNGNAKSLKDALAGAKGRSSEATTITLGANTAVSMDMAVGAGDTLATGANTLTFSAGKKLNVYGTLNSDSNKVTTGTGVINMYSGSAFTATTSYTGTTAVLTIAGEATDDTPTVTIQSGSTTVTATIITTGTEQSTGDISTTGAVNVKNGGKFTTGASNVLTYTQAT